jgi:endonuclease YncB( thermonuclease family)
MLSELASAFFLCTSPSITDGDTVRCANGTRVRLAAVDAPEITACRKGRTCAPGDGERSKRSLAQLIGGRNLSCRKSGTSYNRVVAWCSAGGEDLSCEMWRGGYAIRLEQFDRERRLCR